MISRSYKFLLSEHEQRSPEWFAIRAGRATGSKADAIVSKIKCGEAAARRDYRIQLVTERLTGMSQEGDFQSAAMLWGIEQEPAMRAAYESKFGILVREAGFAYLPDVMAGCSVDGFIDGESFGILEGKCPKSAMHLKYLQEDRLPLDYEPQVLHNLWVTGASFCDFVSFDPRMPENLRLFVNRVERDETKIAAYEDEVFKFLLDVDLMVDSLKRKYM